MAVVQKGEKLHCVVKFMSFTFCLNLAACQSTEEIRQVYEPNVQAVLQLDSRSFQSVEVIELEDIFRLSEKQKKKFLDYYNDDRYATLPGHLRLSGFLHEFIEGFNFRGNTYIASEALLKHSGNCLSLAILTKALANLVGIEVKYQRVNAPPIYQRQQNIITRSSHVRTHLLDPDFEEDTGLIYIFKPKVIIDYFPQRGNIFGDYISYYDFVAMYYQNMAGEALIEGDLNRAYSLIYKAMQVSPKNSVTLNSLAVIFRRANKVAQAEKIFAYAMRNTDGSLSIIENYIVLLEEQNRMSEAEVLRSKIDKIQDDNPYRWIDIADTYFNAGEFDKAQKYYRRALKLAPYLHEGYFGLAKTSYQLGNLDEAEVAMHKALDWSYLPDEQDLYKAKLSALNQMESVQ